MLNCLCLLLLIYLWATHVWVLVIDGRRGAATKSWCYYGRCRWSHLLSCYLADPPECLLVQSVMLSPALVIPQLLSLQLLEEKTFPSLTDAASIYFTHCLAPEMDIAILRYTVTIKSLLIIIYFRPCSISSLFYQWNWFVLSLNKSCHYDAGNIAICQIRNT